MKKEREGKEGGIEEGTEGRIEGLRNRVRRVLTCVRRIGRGIQDEMGS